MSAQAEMYKQIRTIVDHHDDGGCRSRPPGRALAVRLAFADIERLGWEVGEVVYPSKNIRVEAGGQYGSIVIVCDSGCEGREPSGIGAEDRIPSVDDGIVVADSEPARREVREREVVKA